MLQGCLEHLDGLYLHLMCLPDTFCMVSFDNFLSPSPRWSDYVLPAATTWEQEDIISISLGNSLYIPVVSNAPGQAKSQWNFTNDLLKAVGKLKGVGNISLASFGSICWFIGILPPEFNINRNPAFNGLPSLPVFHL